MILGNLYGGCGVAASTGDCESLSGGSIPLDHPFSGKKEK